MKHTVAKSFVVLLLIVCLILLVNYWPESDLVPVAKGWARNSVNATVFRRNSVVSLGDTQYVAFYDDEGHVNLAKRRIGSRQWQIRRTEYQGNVRDAHNSISIMVDGAGYLHMAWGLHGDPLKYCRSAEPGSLEMTLIPSMTGQHEQEVTYPEFYRQPDGNLLFLFRDGESGRGNLVLNHYDCETQQWTQRQDVLIDGQGERNAYWQMCVDPRGALHLSWVWRETYDVATNHDLCYAKSTDGGVTWETSSGTQYEMPISADNAEYAWKIPQESELINSTSMAADAQGRPYIATYWRPEDTEIPQYHLVYHDGENWRAVQVSQRRMPFMLSGLGTKRLPISRPQLAVDESDGVAKAYLIFRDLERGSRVSVAVCDNLQQDEWRYEDLTWRSVDMWEPSYDTELWVQSQQLHVFVQKVGQGDSEELEEMAPTMVSILEWSPK